MQQKEWYSQVNLWGRLLKAAEVPGIQKAWQHAIQTGKVEEGERRLTNKSGREEVSKNASPTMNEQMARHGRGQQGCYNGTARPRQAQAEGESRKANKEGMLG